MYVKDWMSKNPISIPVDATVAEARVLFESKTIRHLPVVDGGVVVGIFSRTDQLRVRDDHQMTTVQQWMGAPAITIEPTATIEQAALVLREHKLGCLPVVDGSKKLIGIITESDVLDLLVDVLGFRSAGARMVLEGDQPEQAIERLANLVREHKLKLRSIVFYHPRGTEQKTRIVARVSGDTH